MAKLNLNALSKASVTIPDVEETISQTVEAISETITQNPDNPSKKARISFKNGKISSISHNEIIQAVEEKSNVAEKAPATNSQIVETSEVKAEEVKKTPARVSLKKQKDEKAAEAASQEIKQENIVQETKIVIEAKAITEEVSTEKAAEMIEEQENSEIKNFTIQDADTRVEMTHHQRKELFTNYAGSYTKEEPKKEEKKDEVKIIEVVSQEILTPVEESIPELSQEKTTENVGEIKNEETKNTRISNKTTPLQNIQKTQKFKKPLIAALGTLSLCVIGGFAFMNLSGEKITGNIQEIPPVQETQVTLPPPVEVEITNITVDVPEVILDTTLIQNTQTGNVNTNTSSDVDNKEKNDKIKDEVKKYLLKKYKPN